MWKYSEKTLEHFLHPRNVGKVENPDGTALVGHNACGDALELTFKVDEDGKINDARFTTHGCASATAAGVPFSMAHGSIRFSLSIYNTEPEIDFVIEKFPPIIEELRTPVPILGSGSGGLRHPQLWRSVPLG